MKILHVNDTYSERGGVEQYLLATARLLNSNNHTNVILYQQRTAHTIQDTSWRAYHISAEVDVLDSLHRIIAIEMPDVAYIHHVSSAQVIETLVALLPTAAYVHGFSAVCPGLAKYFRKGDAVCDRPFGWGCIPMHYLRRCSAAQRPTTLYRLMKTTYNLMQALKTVSYLLVGSNYMRDLMQQNGFMPERISVLPPHFIDKHATTFVEPAPMDEDETMLLYAGRLEIEKGFPYLLQAMTELPSSVRLVVAGDGTLKQEYIALADKLALSDRVNFVGWQTNETINQLYRQSTMLIMPSIMPEPFGRVGIEAMYNSKPVVAFAVGGILDWLEDGVNGLLVEPANSKQLAQKINLLLNNSDLRKQMGQAGRKMVAAQYSAEVHLQKLNKVFHKSIDTFISNGQYVSQH